VRAEGPRVEEKGTTCCHARSDKQWIADPQGVLWETFFTYGEAAVHGESSFSDRGRLTADGTLGHLWQPVTARRCKGAGGVWRDC
jgi:hypothetical protein